jgi:hypothetical protein
MDPNGHINNVAYLAWALEVIPEHIFDDYQLTEVRLAACMSEQHTLFAAGTGARAWSCMRPAADADARWRCVWRRCVTGLPTQVEMDFKAECTAGDVIECLGMPLSGQDAGGGNGCKQQFLHLLRKGDTGAEVWRARTTWSPLSGGSGSSSGSSKR